MQRRIWGDFGYIWGRDGQRMSTHESFYRTFTHLYDQFFPLSSAQVDTLVQLLGNLRTRRVLDVGCGSGSVAIALRRRGWTVDGFDPSAEMIDLARRKAAAEGAQSAAAPRLEAPAGPEPPAPPAPPPEAPRPATPGGGRFWVGRMEELAAWSVGAGGEDAGGESDDSRLQERVGGYDAVLCLGNTLAHAADLAEVERICAAMRGVLRPPAVCIVQGIDFDHVVRERTSELPHIEAAGYRFRRRYGAVDGSGRIPFSISIEPFAAADATPAAAPEPAPDGTPNAAPNAAPDGTMQTETRLLALGERNVVAALAAAGFDSVRRTGSLSGSGETGGLELVVLAELSAQDGASL